MDKEVGNRIQQARIRKGMSRGQLADKSGISSKFIFQIEKQGLGFSVDTLMKITQILDTSYEYLIDGQE